MGYLHIENLYRPEAQTILLLREVYALEKVHGTSAHVRWHEGRVTLSSGGETASRFASLFDESYLAARFAELGHASITVYGEAYGGKQQKQAWRYGPELRFVAFDVMIGEAWLAVPNALDVTNKLGIRFVDFNRVPTDLPTLDAERDRPSTEAKRNGVEGDKPMEGVVLRPLVELRDHRGSRIIAKHKRAEERETATPRDVVDPAKMATLADAEAIASEWVTDTRLAHVLDKLQPDGVTIGMESTGRVIAAMVDDVMREGAGEIVDSKPARQAIGKRAASLFHAKVRTIAP